MTAPVITLNWLESHLWEAANILRGPVDAEDFKTYVFPLLLLKRISDVHDEVHATALSQFDGDEEEALFPEMRRRLIEADLIECVVGLGPNLFYNSPMEAYVVCRMQKPKARRGKILFINAVNEVTRERAQSFLTGGHLQRVTRAYQEFKDELGFTRVVPVEDIRAKEGNLSIPLYVSGETQKQTDAATETTTTALQLALADWLKSSAKVRIALNTILDLFS